MNDDFAKPHFMNEFDNTHIPNMYHDVTLDLSFVKYLDYKLDIQIGKSNEVELSKDIKLFYSTNPWESILHDYTWPFIFAMKHRNAIEERGKYHHMNWFMKYEKKIDEYDTLMEILEYQNDEVIIPMEKLITTNNWSVLEIYNKFQIMDKINMNFLFLAESLLFGDLELVLKYRETCKCEHARDSFTYIFMDNKLSGSESHHQTENSEEIENKLKKTYENKIKFKHSQGDICDNINYITDKYDCIISTPKYRNREPNINHGYFDETRNHFFLINLCRIMLKNLSVGGNLKVNIDMYYTKTMRDIIFLMGKCFKKFYISKESAKSGIIMKTIIGIDKIHDEELKQIKNDVDTIYGKWISNVPANNTKCWTMLTDKDNVLTNLINADNDYYELLDRFTKIENNALVCFTKKREDFLKRYKLLGKDERKQMLEVAKSFVLYSSVKWFMGYDIKVSPKYEDKGLDKITNVIMKKLTNFDTDIMFDYNDNTNNVHEMMNGVEKLNNMYSDFEMYQRMMDNINLYKWLKLESYVKHHRYLKKVTTTHAGKSVTNSFLKLYEILSVYDLFNKCNKVNSFHICESPGQYVMCMNHYMKTKKKDVDWTWYAQSLNSNNNNVKEKYGKYAINDMYDVIDKYPQNWLYGKTNTGDITDIDNIRFYIDTLKDINFITCDCSISDTDNDMYIYTENKMKNVFVSEILCALSILQKGGSMVFVAVLPLQTKFNLSLLYIVHTCFESMCSYKPNISQGSSELYFVCKGFKGCQKNTIDILEKNINRLSANNDDYVVPVPNAFVDIHANMTKIFLEDNKEYVLNKLFIVEFPSFFDECYVNIKNLEESFCKHWISKYKFETIDNDEIL